MVTRLEKYVGWLLAIAALIWAAYLLAGMRGFAGAYLRLGPMQLLMAGILLWLHGKYRTSPSAQGRNRAIHGKPGQVWPYEESSLKSHSVWKRRNKLHPFQAIE